MLELTLILAQREAFKKLVDMLRYKTDCERLGLIPGMDWTGYAQKDADLLSFIIEQREKIVK